MKPHSSVLKYPGGEAKPRGQSPLTPVQKLRGWPVSRILSKAPVLRPAPLDDHSSAAPVARCSQAANPGLWAEASLWRSLLSPPACAFGSRRPFHARPLFGIAPGGACRAGPVTSPAVGFYPTVSPVPCGVRGEPLKQQGSLFSVALSLGLPPPGVTRHPCFMESGLSSKVCTPAVIQPSAREGAYACGTGPSTPKRSARLAAMAASTAVSGPEAPGRKRRRNAPSSVSGGRWG